MNAAACSGRVRLPIVPVRLLAGLGSPCGAHRRAALTSGGDSTAHRRSSQRPITIEAIAQPFSSVPPSVVEAVDEEVPVSGRGWELAHGYYKARHRRGIGGPI